MGHLSSYIHIETMARYHRMIGKNVYFPFGFDDNGLPTKYKTLSEEYLLNTYIYNDIININKGCVYNGYLV
jgi:valyl-tRNA synthetase